LVFGDFSYICIATTYGTTCGIASREINMGIHKRKFNNVGLQHVYQISSDGGVIFYSRVDRLVFYTIASVVSRRHDVEVVQLTIMFNHLHWLNRAANLHVHAGYIDEVTSLYVRSWNSSCGRKGNLVKRPYGMASKPNLKSMMTASCYLGNNPVVKKLVKRGVDDRWTFLAYASGNKYPFSSKPEKPSRPLSRAMKRVDYFRSIDKYLTHRLLWNMFANLSTEEAEFLTDYIISAYAFIKHEDVVSMFGSYENMVKAMDSNSGAEYDIDEVQTKESDQVYIKMIKVASRNGWTKEKRLFTDITDGEALKLIYQFTKECSATQKQIMKFMHLTPADLKRIIHQSGE